MLFRSDRVDPWTLANLGNCYWKTGDLDQAEYCLRGAVAVAPDFTAARLGIATVLHARGRFEDCLQELDAAALTDAGDIHIDSRRGCALLRLERYDEAQAAFRRSAERAGNFSYPRLIEFDRAAWDTVCGDAQIPAHPQAVFSLGNVASAAGHVTLISCDPAYVRKFGFAFMRSFAERARPAALHLHIYDPDPGIIGEVRGVAGDCSLANFVVTTEASPFPENLPRQRRAYYA